MPVPSPRNKILPVRGNIATLQSNVGSLSEGEICYALDENRIYIIEGGALVPTDADATASLFDAGTEALPGLAVTGDPNTGIFSPGADQVAISTAATERLRITSAGNVGIGTTSPNYALDVRATGISISSSFTSDQSEQYITLKDSGTTLGHVRLGSSSGAMLFRAGNSERARIDSSGRLLVGTTSASTSDKLIVQANTSSSTGAAVLGLQVGTTTVSAGVDLGYLNYCDSSGNRGAWILGEGDGTWTSGSSHPGRLVFSTTADGASSPTERMRIDSAGNVGIGTTSPAATLDIGTSSPSIRFSDTNTTGYHAITASNANLIINADPSNETANSLISFNIDGSVKARIDSDGNVGINATPEATAGRTVLTLNGTSGDEVRLNTGGTQSMALVTAANIGIVRAPEASGVLRFDTGGTTERMRIDSEGRLLVGTSSSRATPASISADARLQLEGSDNNRSAFSITNTTNGAAGRGPNIRTARIRGTGIVSSEDILGQWSGWGYDGSDFIEGARIQFNVDATPSAGDMPGRISFYTTPDSDVTPLERMRITSEGDIKFPNAAAIYNGASGGDGIYFGTSGIFPADNTGTLHDNVSNIGSATYRWAVVYAGTGTINTSDATLKQDIEQLEQAEINVATAIKGLVKKFRFVDAVADKGDSARIHVGVIAQEVEQAFVNEGLNPRRYGLFCEDTLDDGTKRLGIRYNELLAFVIAAL